MPKIGDIIKAKTIGKTGTHRYIWSACSICGEEKWVYLYKGKPRAIRCTSCANKGNMNNWKGGRFKNKIGYISLYLDTESLYYPMSMQHRIFEHRLVMAKHLNRCLKSWEVVHHINHIKDDNRIENLKLLKASDHIILTLLEEKNKKLEIENKLLKEKIKKLEEHSEINIKDR